jgi:uncharacterized coiled-coil protein SlyX
MQVLRIVLLRVLSWRSTLQRSAGIAFVVVAFSVPLWAAPTGDALAQDADLQSLSDRVARLQRELQDLQRAFYRGEDVPAPSNLSQSGSLNETQAARLSLRTSQIETALQTLTNQVEEAGFAIDRMNARLDNLVADVDRRLQALRRPPRPRSPGRRPPRPRGRRANLGPWAPSRRATTTPFSPPGRWRRTR